MTEYSNPSHPTTRAERAALVFQYYIEQDLTAKETAALMPDIGFTPSAVIGIANRRGWTKRVMEPVEPLPYKIAYGNKPCRIDRQTVYKMWTRDSSDVGVQAIATLFNTDRGSIRRILDQMDLAPRKRIHSVRQQRITERQTSQRPEPVTAPHSNLPPPSPAMQRLAEFDPIIHRCLALRMGTHHEVTLRESWDLHITNLKFKRPVNDGTYVSKRDRSLDLHLGKKKGGSPKTPA